MVREKRVLKKRQSMHCLTNLLKVFFMKRQDDGENDVDDDDGETQKQAEDVCEAIGNDEVKQNRR